VSQSIGDFMGVLKFRAIYFEHRAAISEQNLGGGFYNARLAEPVGQGTEDFRWGARESAGPHRTLIEVGKRLYGLFLPDNLCLSASRNGSTRSFAFPCPASSCGPIASLSP